jgi:hypothetical protein
MPSLAARIRTFGFDTLKVFHVVSDEHIAFLANETNRFNVVVGQVLLLVL